MTGGTDTRGIDLAAEGFIVEHRVDDGTEIDGSQPPQRETFDRVILERAVAGMVDCDDDEAVRGERSARRRPGRRAAVAVGQEVGGRPGPRRGRRIARGAAGAEERDDGRPDPLPFLARVGCGRVPDHRAECMCLGAAPIVRLGWDKISRGDADLEDSVGARDIYRCEEE